jgi:HSP90 family molecular chaperone
LDEIFTKERAAFEEKWESLGLFVKYGMMTDDKFLEKAAKFHIMEDAKGGKFYTLEEYRAATEALQKNKEDQLVILYTTNPIQQDSYIQQAQAKGYIVVKLETIVDAAFINQMETKWDKGVIRPAGAGTTCDRRGKRDESRGAAGYRDPAGIHAPDEGYGGYERRNGRILCKYAR